MKKEIKFNQPTYQSSSHTYWLPNLSVMLVMLGVCLDKVFENEDMKETTWTKEKYMVYFYLNIRYICTYGRF